MPSHKINIIIQEIEKKNYHLFINIKIGKRSSRLMIDTGASKTVFDSTCVLKFVKKKMLKANKSKSVGLGTSDVVTKIVEINDLKYGTMKVQKMEIAVLDLSHVNHSYVELKLPKIDGVLGSDFLMKYKAVINYPKAVLKLVDGK
jgi:predicted aspartyl protease